MGRLKFLCDVERCIDCSGCVVACKEGNHVPVGVNRRKVITINQGKPGENIRRAAFVRSRLKGA